MTRGTISVAAALTVGVAIGFALGRNRPDSRDEILGKDLYEFDKLNKEDLEEMIEEMNTNISHGYTEVECLENKIRSINSQQSTPSSSMRINILKSKCKSMSDDLANQECKLNYLRVKLMSMEEHCERED